MGTKRKRKRKKKLYRANVGFVGSVHDKIVNNPLLFSLFPIAFLVHFVDMSFNYPKSTLSVSLFLVMPVFALIGGISVYALLWLDRRERILSFIISLFLSLSLATLFIVDDTGWFIRFNRNTSVFLTHLAIIVTQYTLIVIVEEIVSKLHINNGMEKSK